MNLSLWLVVPGLQLVSSLQPAEAQQNFSSSWLFLTSKPLLVLVISRPKISRYLTCFVRQKKTGFHALEVSHQVLFGSCSDHVIHVAQEDRIIFPFLTLFATYVEGSDLQPNFHSALSAPNLWRNLKSLTRLHAQPNFGMMYVCFKHKFHTQVQNRSASVTGEKHCDKSRKRPESH